ncbi:hypothetical protein Q3G72_013941 [Acer saccharum]|nr:hypothetical protein Q3G72_013941 [Acer saccharum]
MCWRKFFNKTVLHRGTLIWLQGKLRKLVVEGPSNSVIIPDGAALSAFQYFENVRNFLVAVEELGLPTFEASDLNSEWKQSGGHGSWKFGANGKPSSAGTGKPFMRKNSEPFMNSFSRTLSVGEKSLDSDLGNDLSEAVSELCLFICLCFSCHVDTNKTPKKPYLRSNLQGSSGNFNSLVRAFLSDRKQEEITSVVESMLNKVMEEFERRLASQNEQMKAAPTDVAVSVPDNSLTRSSSGEVVVGI